MKVVFYHFNPRIINHYQGDDASKNQFYNIFSLHFLNDNRNIVKFIPFTSERDVRNADTSQEACFVDQTWTAEGAKMMSTCSNVMN